MSGRTGHHSDASSGPSPSHTPSRDEPPTLAALPSKAKRKRITPEQQAILTKLYETTDTPNLETRERLSRDIGMTPREIQVHAQNQRAKRRRLAKQQQQQQPQGPPAASTSAASTSQGSGPSAHRDSDSRPGTSSSAGRSTSTSHTAWPSVGESVAVAVSSAPFDPTRRRSLDSEPSYSRSLRHQPQHARLPPPRYPHAPLDPSPPTSATPITRSTTPSTSLEPSPAVATSMAIASGMPVAIQAGLRLPPLREVFGDLFPSLPPPSAEWDQQRRPPSTATGGPEQDPRHYPGVRPPLLHGSASFPPPYHRRSSEYVPTREEDVRWSTWRGEGGS